MDNPVPDTIATYLGDHRTLHQRTFVHSTDNLFHDTIAIYLDDHRMPLQCTFLHSMGNRSNSTIPKHENVHSEQPLHMYHNHQN
jgi:hypothetical protein